MKILKHEKLAMLQTSFCQQSLECLFTPRFSPHLSSLGKLLSSFAVLQEREEEIRSCFEGQGNVCLGKLFFHKAARKVVRVEEMPVLSFLGTALKEKRGKGELTHSHSAVTF